MPGSTAIAARTGHYQRIINLLWAVCVAIFLATLLVPRIDGQLVGSDGTYYYAELRSLVFDRDLDLANEVQRLVGMSLPDASAKFPVGLPLAWLPFFGLAHLITLAGRATGLPLQADGYSWVYQAAICLGTLAWGWLGFRLIFRICCRWATPRSAFWATLLIWWGWNVVYYLVLEPSMSHLVSMTLVSAVVAVWLAGLDEINDGVTKKPGVWEHGARRWWLLGVLLGGAAMVRPQDLAFGLLPATSLLIGFSGAVWQRRTAQLVRTFRAGLLLLGGVVIGYLPQMLVATWLYGHPLRSGYIVGGETFNWVQPQIGGVLFSLWHGLLTWHPLLWLALGGLVLLARRAPRVGWPMLAAVAVQVYVIGAWHTWWQGDAFGGRMLINCAPVFALGLAVLLDRVATRWRGWPWLVAAPALAWNLLFVVQYRLGFIPKATPITWEQLTLGKLTVVGQLIERILR